MRYVTINRKLILGIFIVEAVLCSLEAIFIIVNHLNHREQWAWFFTFTANLPASAIMAYALSWLFETFAIRSFTAEMMCFYLVLLFGGTLWWSLLLHGLIAIFRAVTNTAKGIKRKMKYNA